MKIKIIFLVLLCSSMMMETTKNIDISEIYKVQFFAMGGVGFSGEQTLGEKIFSLIISQDNNLKTFHKVYIKGNNNAKVYAICL